MIKKIKVPILDFDLYLCSSLEEYRKFEKKNGIEPPPEDSDALGYCSTFMIKGKASTLIGVFDGQLTTLVHECGHAVFRMLQSRYIPINPDNDEIFCYLFEFIFASCYKVMKRKESPDRVSPQPGQADHSQGHHDKSVRSKDLHGGADVSSVRKGED